MSPSVVFPHGLVNWHIGRCGSSVLGSLLEQHSQVAYSNEIYSRYMPRRRNCQVLPSIEQVLDNSLREVAADWHLIEIKHLVDQNLGLYPNLNVRDWLDVLMARGYRHHLLLRRRNGLRRIVSHLRAARTGQYVLSASTQAQPPMAVEVNLNSIKHGFANRSLLDWLYRYERGHTQMLQVFHAARHQYPDVAWLELSYEEHIEQDPRLAYGMVCDFLGIDRETVEVRHRRINPGPLPLLISNYDDVRDCLESTRFAWMLTA